MNGFFGAFNLSHGAVDFSQLRRIRGAQGGGCAFINNEFGILCDGVPEGRESEQWQPTTVKYNNSLYTSAIIMDKAATGLESSTACALLEGYLEEGERYFRRLDFSYALALYDGRCGELILRKGYRGDKPLFYTLRDNILYFATSLQSLIKLYGGCVKVNKNMLCNFIFDNPPSQPRSLFYNIFSLGAGEMLICSSFGYDVVTSDGAVSNMRGNLQRVLPYVNYTKSSDIRRILTDTLFLFGYPQFDCYMPSAIQGIHMVEQGRTYGIDEALYGEYPDYAVYRAECMGVVFGIDVCPLAESRARPSQRELRAMDKALDRLLDEYADELQRFFSSEQAEAVRNEKNIPLRIRRKGMMYQTVIWQEHFNIVFD